MPWYSFKMDEARATPGQCARQSHIDRLIDTGMHARVLLPKLGYRVEGFVSPLNVEPPITGEHRAALEARAGYPIAVQEVRMTETVVRKSGDVTVIRRDFYPA